MGHRRAVSVAMAAGLWVAACSAPSSGARDVRQDLTLRLDPTGSVDVHETWTARFAPGSTRFAVRIPAQFTDGLSGLTALGDGGQATIAGTTGHQEISCAQGCDIAWSFAPDSGRVHVFDVGYRATGVLTTDESHGSLRWPLLPPDRGFRIARAEARLIAPALTFTGRAGIDPNRGWTLTRRPDGLDAEKDDVGPSDDVALVAEFVIDPSAVAEPAWQEVGEEAETLGPAFVAGGLALAAVGIGVVWMTSFQYPTRRPSTVTAADRRTVKRGLIGGGISVVALGAICAAVVPIVLGRFGPWPYFVPAGTVIAGVIMLGWSLRY